MVFSNVDTGPTLATNKAADHVVSGGRLIHRHQVTCGEWEKESEKSSAGLLLVGCTRTSSSHFSKGELSIGSGVAC